MAGNPRVFAIGDLHIGHKAVLQFEPVHRPFATIEEHDEEFVYRWNGTVRKNDVVWVVGDVAFGVEAFDVLARLNGVKKLVMGNHDEYPMERYMAVFSKVYGITSYRKFILSHVPVHPAQMRRFRGNVHGHMHAKVLDDYRYINVSAERVNLTPILFDKLVHDFEEKERAYLALQEDAL